MNLGIMEMTKEDILKDLLMTPSPSGCEQAIIKKMAMFLKDYIDELSIDNYGNLIALKYGNQRNKKLMLAAHADEVGMMVTYIDMRAGTAWGEGGYSLYPGNSLITCRFLVIFLVVSRKKRNFGDRNIN